MARIVLGSYLFRYPLGGMISWVNQYLLGLLAAGHEVYFVEKSAYQESCYNPILRESSNDCRYGLEVVVPILTEIGLAERWCFVDSGQRYYGMGKAHIENVFRSADLYIEMGAHEAWLEESSWATSRILVDGDPGFSQLEMTIRNEEGNPPPNYDFYFTLGRNLCGSQGKEPRGGVSWNPIFPPVCTKYLEYCPGSACRPFTTVMNWRSRRELEYLGRKLGHKNIEFTRFKELPLLTTQRLEIAVSGRDVPFEELTSLGWLVRDAQELTLTLGGYYSYIKASGGELSVCKNGFVELKTGWFGDRSACYLAFGRPVILQDTGFSDHLPTGKGLFSFTSAEQAVEALTQIRMDYETHCAASRDIAEEFMEAKKVMEGVLEKVGV